MKPINIPFRHSTEFSISTDPVDVLHNSAFNERVNLRKEKIISGAVAIEDVIKNILLTTIFEEISTNRELITLSILDSDWCSFGAKRKLLNVAIDTFQLFKGKEKSTLDKHLSKVMKYRNAFAHGSIISKDGVYYLKYFDSKSIEQELDDEFWEKIETCFMGAFTALTQAESTILAKA